MNILGNNYSVKELLDMLDRADLTINKEYQRGAQLWPQGARSYFIDTILEKFPFPKLYIYEHIDSPFNELTRELVDGQQRLMTIVDFVKGKFALTGTESNFSGLRFEELDGETQRDFLSYTVSVDVIRDATNDQILQLFRRMNAYTLPLNTAEKRHSQFQGEFKWAINRLSAELNSFFLEFGVFTRRQIVRMADAELLTDCILAMENGIVNTTPTLLENIYQIYDGEFREEEEVVERFREVFHFISEHFFELRKSHMMKPYSLYSLITAMVHSRYGIPALCEQLKIESKTGKFCEDPEDASSLLLALAQAHEAKESEGPDARYVWGCLGGTNRATRRTARIEAIFNALGLGYPTILDDTLLEKHR